MINKPFIFIAGLHRTGTSLLYKLIRDHPQISGFINTGVPEDEGQHLQNIYKPAKAFGGPGKFAFHQEAYMDENHPLATEENAKKIYHQWAQYLDTDKKYLIEKSPPNIIRTRFLQKLFPNSKFIIVLRHPIAVSYATQKWSNNNIDELIKHYLIAYEKCLKEDISNLSKVHIIYYEDLIYSPQTIINNVFNFIGVYPISIKKDIYPNINQKYFDIWEKEKKLIVSKDLDSLYKNYEERINQLGYSLKSYSLNNKKLLNSNF